MDQENADRFPPLMNDAVLKVARGEKPHRVPVWIMRQAGRYLPEFRELRSKHDFFEIVNTPELACEVTMQPIRRFDLDASIIFSDILVVPQAVGMEVIMEASVGPVLPKPLNTPDDMKKLNFDVDVKDKMSGTLEAITLTRTKLNGKVPLIGFTGAPWTLMAYMIEGKGNKTLSKSKGWLYQYPEDSDVLLGKLADVVIRYLVEQVASGAQLLQVFESHADLLSPKLFRRFCVPILKRIREETVSCLEERGLTPVPMIIFAKGAHYALEDIALLGYEVVGVDWTMDPKSVRQRLGRGIVVQGNLDPCALYANKEYITENGREITELLGPLNYICNLGHGINPDTPIESVEAFIETVHSCTL